jgi:hypothetical protein
MQDCGSFILTLKETIGIILGLGDSLSAFSFIRVLLILLIQVWIPMEGNIPVPSQFSSWKKQDIMEWGIGSLTLMNPFETTSFEMQNNVSSVTLS